MLKIKSLSLRNFLSIGNVVQNIDFNNKDLTLILGENLDLGGNDAGSRNGVGKTSMLQGLSYALFGSAINSIKKDNLINRTNEKNMNATVEFSINNTEYKIIRGRKPNVLKFFINDSEQAAEDNSQGDSRQTQEAIERVLCMSSTMFQHIVGLNSYTTPFLSMKVGDQREVIEQLLGITLLSEKADAIKELNKQIKDEIKLEEYRIGSVDEANKRIQEQIDNLKRRQMLWLKKRDGDLDALVNQYTVLTKVDIDAELQAHRDLVGFTERVKQKEIYKNLVSRQSVWKNKHSAELATLEQQLITLDSFDITAELKAHTDLALWNQQSKDIADLEKFIARGKLDEAKEAKLVEKLRNEVIDLESHKCYACGQDFHDANHGTVLADKRKSLEDATNQSITTSAQMSEAIYSLEQLGSLGGKPTTFYRTEADAIRHSSEVMNIAAKIDTKSLEVDPYAEQLAEAEDVVVGERPITIYPTETEAIEHRSMVASLEQQIAKKNDEIDPYAEQVTEMEQTAIQEISYDEINRLNKQFSHQDYLLDLLTNKKSFVRKKIIEQNLSYLNARLAYYLDKIGLPHRVVFQNDLSVEITELGRDMDFDNCSRGERNRVILGLSFAFRDVFENLFMPINLVFVDELMDSGMDAAGVENGLALLRDMTRRRNKSVWLVSHREELISRVNSILKVVKSGGFTEFQFSDEE